MIVKKFLLEQYDVLFSGPPLDLGKFFWYISKSNTEMETKCGYIGDLDENETKEFLNELEGDEIYWWIAKRETDINDLLEKSKLALKSAQLLKEKSAELRDNPSIEENKDIKSQIINLIKTIKNLLIENKDHLSVLLEYAKYLYNKDKLAPSILFTYKIWGSTRLSERTIYIHQPNFNENDNILKTCLLISLGIEHNGGDQIMNSIIIPNYGVILRGFSNEEATIARIFIVVLREFATFFELIRQSLRNIIIEIEKIKLKNNLLHDDLFWDNLIQKARNQTENRLWDFKKSLTMWEGSTDQIKKQGQVDFCEKVAAFANKKGGVIIIGISDKIPRKVFGVEDLETKIESIGNAIRLRNDYDKEFYFIKEVGIKDEDDITRSCIIIAIQQTSNVVGVKRLDSSFTYPKRIETGLELLGRSEIEDEKLYIFRDNYDFLQDLKSFVD